MESKETRKERFEAFKAGLLKWKADHREEYNEFARQMSDCDEECYLHIFRSVSLQLPHIAKEWQLSWGDDGEERFDSIFLQFGTGDVPTKIASMFGEVGKEQSSIDDCQTLWDKIKRKFRKSSKPRIQLSAPLVLSWLFYGKSFETMVSMVNKQMSKPQAGRFEKMRCAAVVKAVISTSIKGGYRTREDWRRYFNQEKAVESGNVGEWALQDVIGEAESKSLISKEPDTSAVQEPSDRNKASGRKKSREYPLIDYLPEEHGEALIACIRSFISVHTSAYNQALPFYVLRKLDLLKGMVTAKEYGIAMARQFPGLDGMKSESALRQAVGKLQERQQIVKGGKTQMRPLIESDENQALLTRLEADILSIIKPVIKPADAPD